MVNIIVAFSKNRAIGLDGKIPWIIKDDKAHFRNLTMNGVLIMGRRTFEEIGKPLPGREIVVVSSSRKYEEGHLHTVQSFEDAVLFAGKMFPEKEIFVSGGERIYVDAMKVAERIYATEIDGVFKGDRFFPAIDDAEFEKVSEEKVCSSIGFSFCVYLRKRQGGRVMN